MQTKISVIPNTDIAYFVRCGQVGIDERKDNRNCILDFCEKNGITQAIVDACGQESSASILECFNFGAEIAVLMNKLRIAVLHKQGDESIDYILNSAVSRGLQIKGFLKKEEAIEWLS